MSQDQTLDDLEAAYRRAEALEGDKERLRAAIHMGLSYLRSGRLSEAMSVLMVAFKETEYRP